VPIITKFAQFDLAKGTFFLMALIKLVGFRLLSLKIKPKNQG